MSAGETRARGPRDDAGNSPFAREPWPTWPQHFDGDLPALTSVLESHEWGGVGAPAVLGFESAWATYLDARHAISCSNGTVSLSIALQALGIGHGDEVIVPSYTFYATATAVLTAQAIPVFADIDPTTLNLDVRHVEALITPRTKAVIVVHFAGLAVDLDEIQRVCSQRGIALIEDAAHAHGAEWRGRKVGAFGAFGSWSFQSSKNVTAGEGGALTTNDPALAARANSLRNCGRIPEGAWYEHHLLGANHRMTAFQAAILIGAVERLPEQFERREVNARLLDTQLSAIPGLTPQGRDFRHTAHAHHLYVFRYEAESSNSAVTRDQLIQRLQSRGIPATGGYPIPLYRQPIFADYRFSKPAVGWEASPERQQYDDIIFAGTEKVCREAIWLPHSLLLAEPQRMAEVVEAVHDSLAEPV
jgi:dTDP-4-amino-4,6-dideoxygalactose transaminase